MLWWTEANASWSNRSATATYEHANSASFSIRLQLTGGDMEPKEPSRYRSGNPRLMVPEDPGAKAASPGVVLLKTLAPAISVPVAPQGAACAQHLRS
jgi:hypothetical protein